MSEKTQQQIRSDLGQRFHFLLCDYLFNPGQIKVGSDGLPSRDDPHIQDMQKILEDACKPPTKIGFLGDCSANKYSILQDIVHLPFDIKVDRKNKQSDLIYDKKSAEELAVFLWDFVVGGNWWKVAPPKLKADILSSCGGSFSLPQDAAKSGSEAIFRRVMDECKSNLLTNDYANLLNNITKDGFSLPQTAAASGSEAIFGKVMDEPLSKEALEARPYGFTLLLNVAKNGTLEMFKLAAERIKVICGEAEYFKQLTEPNNAEFTPFQSADTQGKRELAAHIQSEIENRTALQKTRQAASGQRNSPTDVGG